MRSFRFRIALSLLFMLASFWGSTAQEMKITSIERAGGDVLLSYDLIDKDVSRRYSVFLYTSRDNFLSPLTMVEGNIGVDQTVGGGKTITWHAREEFGVDFNDDISLELKGNIYVPFVNISNFGKGRIIKRTSPFDLTWAGGRGDNVLTIELFQDDNLIYFFDEEPATTGNTTLAIPSKIKPGTGYQLKISDKRNRDEVVFTPHFEVKRKIPQVYKIIGAFVAGGLTAILIDSLVPPPDIPPPPSPSGGG